jgi:hypothetical protein
MFFSVATIANQVAKVLHIKIIAKLRIKFEIIATYESTQYKKIKAK